MDSENEQHIVAAEFFVWADTEDQARAKLNDALRRLEFDYEVERKE